MSDRRNNSDFYALLSQLYPRDFGNSVLGPYSREFGSADYIISNMKELIERNSNQWRKNNGKPEERIIQMIAFSNCSNRPVVIFYKPEELIYLIIPYQVVILVRRRDLNRIVRDFVDNVKIPNKIFSHMNVEKMKELISRMLNNTETIGIMMVNTHCALALQNKGKQMIWGSFHPHLVNHNFENRYEIFRRKGRILFSFE